MKSGSNGINQPGSGKDSGPDQYRRHQKKQGEDGLSQPGSFLMTSLRTQTGIYRDERCREHAFAEEVLQKIGDAEGGAKGICRSGSTKIMRKDALPDQTNHAAE